MIDVPAAYERRQWSRADAAAELGISERQYRRRLAAARRVLPELGDPPHVPITDGPAPGYCYRVDADQLSRLPLGLMRIGEGPPVAKDGGGAGSARPGRLEGRLRVRHFNEDLGERPAEPKAAGAGRGRAGATPKPRLTREEVDRIVSRIMDRPRPRGTGRRKGRPA